MPCKDNMHEGLAEEAVIERSGLKQEVSRLQSRLNETTRLLCLACQSIGEDRMDAEMRHWWETHEKLDREHDRMFGKREKMLSLDRKIASAASELACAHGGGQVLHTDSGKLKVDALMLMLQRYQDELVRIKSS